MTDNNNNNKIENLIDGRILTEQEKQIITCESCDEQNLWVDMPESSPTICQKCRFSTYPKSLITF